MKQVDSLQDNEKNPTSEYIENKMKAALIS